MAIAITIATESADSNIIVYFSIFLGYICVLDRFYLIHRVLAEMTVIELAEISKKVSFVLKFDFTFWVETP